MNTKTFFSFVLTAMFLIGCQSRNHIEEQLAIIDTLLIHDKVDSAKILLEKIPQKSLRSHEDSAYYFLVQTETNYRNRIPLESDHGINYSQKFYEKTKNREKLARTYFYKGVTTFSKNSINKTFVLLKQAEELADQTDNLLLRHKIYEKLSYP